MWVNCIVKRTEASHNTSAIYNKVPNEKYESGSMSNTIHHDIQYHSNNISKNAILYGLNKPSHTALWSILTNSVTSTKFNLDTSSFGGCHHTYKNLELNKFTYWLKINSRRNSSWIFTPEYSTGISQEN